jgi:purine-binding chemotaxis protein CheW
MRIRKVFMTDEVSLLERPTVSEAAASSHASSRSTRAATGSPASPLTEYLTFRVGAEEYAIDILRVQEIRGYSPMTRIAHAPATVKGVVNLRGVIVPVVDLRICLQAGELSRDEDTVTVVLDLGVRVVGAVVDSVSDVLTLSAADIRPAPEMRHNTTANSILGMACLGEGADARMLVVLDIERLLSDADTGL